MVRSEQNDDNVWNELYQTTLDIADLFGINEKWQIIGSGFHRDFEVNLDKAMDVFVAAKNTKGRFLKNIQDVSQWKMIKYSLNNLLIKPILSRQNTPFCV